MAKKLTKALRGKRRWIGCKCEGFESRGELENFMSEYPVKIYDFEDEKCILVVRLEDYDSIRESLSQGRVVSVTSSGKIRLIRERMNFKRKPRKR
jgi:hypothetical protein|tara:strand:+ start:472 stop:756 length:285 start_codon:yes stop_codon:yes gene_type:complete